MVTVTTKHSTGKKSKCKFIPKKIAPILRSTQIPEETIDIVVLTTKTLEEELYGRLRYFLILSQIFLCAPAGAHQYNPKKVCTNILALLVHLLWCATFYIILFGCIYYEYTHTNVELPVVLKPLRFSEYVVYTLHVLLVAIGSYWARDKYYNFLQSLFVFEYDLLKFKQFEEEQPNYQKLTKFLRIHLILIAMHFICIAITDYYYNGEILYNFIITLLVHTLPNIVLEISLVQYYALLYMISLRAILLNCILHRQLESESVKDVNMGNTKQPKLPDTFDLQYIRLLYAHLERLMHEVNDSFGISLVFCYVGSFTNLSINVFLIYDCIDSSETFNWSLFIYSVMWSLMDMGKMFLILYYNDAVQQQKNATMLLLNEYNSANVAMEETITHFILQLNIKTRSNVVCGVTALDMDFITSILGTLSTMFIFLLQYNITYEALNVVHKTPTNT